MSSVRIPKGAAWAFVGISALAAAVACNAKDAAPTNDAGADGGAGAACVDGVKGVYPPSNGTFGVGLVLPRLSFGTEESDGSAGAFDLASAHDPCSATPRLLVLRASASFCGPCQWFADHPATLREGVDDGARSVLDVLVADEDNAPPSLPAAARWRARSGARGPILFDEEHRFRALLPASSTLPLFVLVDGRTMTVLRVLADPQPKDLRDALAKTAAELAGEPPQPGPAPERFDGLFSTKEWDLLKAMTPPGAPPADPTNAKGDDAKAAVLGAKMFEDKLLSPSGTVACATCHDPKKAFQDGLPVSVGVAKGQRNTPSILLAAHARWQFWDGRADTLWMQATGPLENPLEMAGSRLFVVHALLNGHRAEMEAVFGPQPDLTDAARFPAAGKPGDAAWEAMSAVDRSAVNAVFARAGKAFAAFERTLRIAPDPLDAYVAGDPNALTADQKTGLHHFFAAGCAQCHHGPRLTDDAFHVLRFPDADGRSGDVGRSAGLPTLLASELRRDGPFADVPGATLGPFVANARLVGAFRTPTLRGVASTAPYGHGGSVATLADVMALYGKAGLPPEDSRAVGTVEPWVVKLDVVAEERIADFLRVLTAP